MSNIKMSNIKYDKFENSLKAQGKAGFHIFKCTFVTLWNYEKPEQIELQLYK